MSEWHNKLASQILGDAAPHLAGFSPGADASLEIAFGRIRTEVTYVLELCRAHRLPVTGNTMNDDVWFALGPSQARFVFDRKAGTITATTPGREGDLLIAWSAASNAVVGPDGAPCDTRALAREAIDAVVAADKATRATKP